MLVSFENPGLSHILSKKASRSSIGSSKVLRSCTGWRNPDGDVSSVSHMASKSALSRACSSGVIGRLLSGVHQLAVRWYTVSEATSPAMAGITCTPLDPVPMTATRLPAKSTGVVGHRPVWYDSPRKSLAPGHVREVRHREDAGGGDQEPRPVLGARRRSRTVHVPDDSS